MFPVTDYTNFIKVNMYRYLIFCNRFGNLTKYLILRDFLLECTLSGLIEDSIISILQEVILFQHHKYGLKLCLQPNQRSVSP